jgi:hypothetical protein
LLLLALNLLHIFLNLLSAKTCAEAEATKWASVFCVGWLKSFKNSHGGINEAGRAEFVEGKRLTTTQGGEEGKGRRGGGKGEA